MNLSTTSTSETVSRECEIYDLLGGKLDHNTTGAYVVLVFLTIVNIITCPLTIVLNSLVIFAVKTKARLKTNSNIALGCLAFTDVLMGVIGQPIFAVVLITILQGDRSNEHCMLLQLSRIVIRLLGGASIRHLVLISVERYAAIKHPFAYTSMVTKARILGSSALAWITVVVANTRSLTTDSTIFLTINNILLFIAMAAIVYCQVTVYSETRRHEKQIAEHQVSEETRQKFLKEKKALKLTTTLILTLLLCYLPTIIFRILLVTSTITSVNIAYIAYITVAFLAMLNSIINPIIYCVRIRQFRVAFIQILLRKHYTQAEQFERRMFGTLDIVTPLETGQQREEVQNISKESPNNNTNNGYTNSGEDRSDSNNNNKNNDDTNDNNNVKSHNNNNNDTNDNNNKNDNDNNSGNNGNNNNNGDYAHNHDGNNDSNDDNNSNNYNNNNDNNNNESSSSNNNNDDDDDDGKNNNNNNQNNNNDDDDIKDDNNDSNNSTGNKKNDNDNDNNNSSNENDRNNNNNNNNNKSYHNSNRDNNNKNDDDEDGNNNSSDKGNDNRDGS